MKFSIVLTFGLLVLSLFSCGNKENGLSANLINGDATSFTDTIWNVTEKFGEVVKDDIREVIKVNLDDNGNITDYTNYDYDGEITEKTIQKWKGETLDEVFKYNSDGEQEFHFKYYFENEKLKKIVSTCTMSSKWESTETYYYSPNNPDRLDSIIYISELDEGKDVHTFKYLDDNNSYHEYIQYCTGNKSDAVYYFDKDKHLIKEKQSYGTTTYTYNDKGLLVKMVDSDGTSYEYIYEYDNKGSLIKSITYETKEIKKPTQMLTRHIDYK